MLTNLIFTLIQLIFFISIFLVIVLVINQINTKNDLSTKVFSKIGENIFEVKKRSINIKSLKYVTPVSIVIISVCCFVIAFIIVYSFLRLFVSSVIISIPFAFIPYLLLRFRVQQEKEKIKRLLPIYAINLKGHISSENNIILAIKRTKVEEPLYKYISKFIINVERGMNISDSFNILKRDVDISEFTELISAFQVCYQNGGKFVNILDVFSKQVSQVLMLEEKEKDKTMSSVITLVVMVALNILLVVSYVFGNKEFASIIRESITGHIIMDINAISCVLCCYFLFKMYKMEE